MEGILIPQKVFIGDMAQFLYPLEDLCERIDDIKLIKTNLDSFQIENLHQNSQMTITKIGIKIQEEKEFLAISFIPYETGEIVFPSLIEIGVKYALPNIKIASILEETKVEVLQAPRPPILIPGTTNLIYIITGSFTAFIFLFLFATATIKRRFIKKTFAKIQRKRIKSFYKKLKKLQRKAKSFNNLKDEKKLFIANWLKEFEIALNEYCINIILNSTKLKNEIPKSPTYSEILSNLKNEFENSIDIYLEFKDIFLKLQRSRFQKSNFETIKFDTSFIHFINKSFYIVKISEEQIEKNKLQEEANDKI